MADITKDLSNPDEAHAFHYVKEFVRVNREKIVYEYINQWRLSCAERVITDWSVRSCIIDGVIYGPPLGPRGDYIFVTSRPYVANLGFRNWEGESGGTLGVGKERWEKVDMTMKIGFKVTYAQRAPFRAYPEVEAEQRGHLLAAIAEAIDGRPQPIRVPTVTDATGRPKSA